MTDRKKMDKLPPGFVCVVCGTRSIHARGRLLVFEILDEMQPSIVVQGGASGVDCATAEWACERSVACVEVKANWEKMGRRAGPVRNGWMLDLGPDAVIAFPGGSGTASMVKQARRRGFEVIEPLPGVSVPDSAKSA